MKIVNRGILIFITFSVATSTQAQLMQNLFLGNAKAFSLGNAVTADPPGIDSIHFNPAGLTALKGRQYQLKIAGAFFDVKADFSSSEEYEYQLNEVMGRKDPILDDEGNATSNVNGITVMLPFFGLVDLPGVIAPVGGFSYQNDELNPDVTIANAIYAPIILGFNRSDDDPGIYQGKQFGVSRITYLSPSIGYRINSKLSIGASLGINYMGVGLDLPVRIPNILLAGIDQVHGNLCSELGSEPGVCAGRLDPLGQLVSLSGELQENFSPTFNLGFLWDVTSWLTWGAVYQHGANDMLKGQFDITFSEDVMSFVTGLNTDLGEATGEALNRAVSFPTELSSFSTGASLNLKYPRHLATGLKLQLFDRLQINIDLKWVETGLWDEWVIQFEEEIDLFGLLGLITPYASSNTFTLPRGWVDVVSWAYGAEFRYSDRLKLRFGYEPRGSSIPDNKRDYILPVADLNLYGFGFNYKLDSNSDIDFTLTYIVSDEYIPSDSSDNINSGAADNFIYNPYAGQNIDMSLRATAIELAYNKRL